MTLQEEITRRRTFAVIAHPDAGKTTLTEKLLLFGGAMANARYVSKSVDGWCAGVEAALAAAEAEDWEGAREALGAVYASWDARQTYFHIMVEHAELDAAEALFAVSHSFAESEDGAEFRANTAELLTQLRLLDEMEEISIKNIL